MRGKPAVPAYALNELIEILIDIHTVLVPVPMYICAMRRCNGSGRRARAACTETYNHANAEKSEFYKEKSCKLAEENMMLKKRIEKLESKMQMLAMCYTSPNQPNQPNQPCKPKEDETNDVYQDTTVEIQK